MCPAPAQTQGQCWSHLHICFWHLLPGPMPVREGNRSAPFCGRQRDAFYRTQMARAYLGILRNPATSCRPLRMVTLPFPVELKAHDHGISQALVEVCCSQSRVLDPSFLSQTPIAPLPSSKAFSGSPLPRSSA